MSLRCVACQAELPEEAAFCHRCGKAVAAAAEGDQVARRFATRVGRSVDVPETELWSGTFSAKGMISSWLLAAALTVILPIVAIAFQAEAPQWTFLAVAIVGFWLTLLAWLGIQKLDTHYVLTNQRLIHMHGILTRQTNRVETIDIDDVGVTQGIVERFLNVGTIEVVSTDATDPELIMKGIDDVQRVSRLIDEARRQERLRRGLHVESI